MTSVVQPHSTAEVQKLVKDEETGKLVCLVAVFFYMPFSSPPSMPRVSLGFWGR